MDAINILIGINIIATFGANASVAGKGLKSKLSQVTARPVTYLQNIPLYIATIILVSQILGVFQIGTFTYLASLDVLRITALIFYLIFSWIQIWVMKTLGDNYSQEIVVKKNHLLVTKGFYGYVRHPFYMSQIIADISVGIALLSWIVLPLVIIQIPLLVMRAQKEDELFEKYFQEEYKKYKKKTGFIFPYIG
jgi:protein-S-isoprenylcysteine O-methyltransferase Ste14